MVIGEEENTFEGKMAKFLKDTFERDRQKKRVND